MKLPQETELLNLKITFYKMVNFVMAVGILASALYGLMLLGKAIFG